MIVVTDGRMGVGCQSLKSSLQMFRQQRDRANEDKFPLPFPFSSRIHVLCIEDSVASKLSTSISFYQKMIDINGGEGQVFVPEGPLSFKTVRQMFLKLCETYYVPFHGVLRCGNLFSHVQLSPPPEPYHKARDFETIRCTASQDIHICGFLDMSDVSSPASYSRHLVLPIPPPKGITITT